MTDYLALAREAAIETYGKFAVGEFSHTVQEDQDGVLSYLFASKLKGYPDWNIAVTLYINGWEATVSEVLLTPAETSLVAPKWVPWSERLADYKALQAALEAEAAAAAALAAEGAEDEDDDLDEADDEDLNEDVEADTQHPLEAPEANGVLSTESVADAAVEQSTRKKRSGKKNVDLPVADVPEAPESKDDADDAGGKSKGLFKWKTLRGKKKNK